MRAKKKRNTPEKATERAIMAWLSYQPTVKAVSINCGRFKTPNGSFFTATSCTGVSDILCCINGKFVCFEVKHGKNKQTKNQIEFENEVKKAGGQYYTVYSVDEVMEIFKNI